MSLDPVLQALLTAQQNAAETTQAVVEELRQDRKALAESQQKLVVAYEHVIGATNNLAEVRTSISEHAAQVTGQYHELSLKLETLARTPEDLKRVEDTQKAHSSTLADHGRKLEGLTVKVGIGSAAVAIVVSAAVGLLFKLLGGG